MRSLSGWGWPLREVRGFDAGRRGLEEGVLKAGVWAAALQMSAASAPTVSKSSIVAMVVSASWRVAFA